MQAGCLNPTPLERSRLQELATRSKRRTCHLGRSQPGIVQGIGIKKQIFIESINTYSDSPNQKTIFTESTKNIRCAVKSLVPSRVGGRCSPLVHWSLQSAGPLVRGLLVF